MGPRVACQNKNWCSTTAESCTSIHTGALRRLDKQDIWVIHDPLGQTHSPASSEHCFLFFGFARFRKKCAKTMIPTGRDSGFSNTCVINDLLGQTHCPSFLSITIFTCTLFCESLKSGQTTCVKIVITTGRESIIKQTDLRRSLMTVPVSS